MKFGKHRDFILSLSKCIECKNYLELGVCSGQLLNQIAQSGIKSTGVDIVDNRTVKNKDSKFYLMSTKDFFENIASEKYDLIFVDASHKIEDVCFDILNSVKYLNPNGIIAVHDTDPSNKKLVNENGDFCGDAIKINSMDFTLSETPLDKVTLPITNEGLTIFRRSNETRVKI